MVKVSPKVRPVLDATSARKFQFISGSVCLDLCNTVGGKRGARIREDLNSFADFAAWCEQAGLVDKSEGEVLVRMAARHPADGASVLARALALREAIYRIFCAVANDKDPEPADLAQLNCELAGALGRLRVGSSRDGFAWQWAKKGSALDEALGPIARSAAELLTASQMLNQVRQCRGDNCGWLFVDGSKNHSRRWCDMRDCGNRAKVRRHRLKQRREK